ncbi:Phosphoenolpyruvate/pyruvate domain-containing protein [Pterulicium gracile]|uniref:Phosphoenolpyruvate/pyruvate domain-containing protein n=1 Tax=Pterulicium gracile TaxID=1884261 RepID=A0A5C3QFL4_9AGAR|nr:Phosphoenolpyruvate/pyruvate domain-containing protein [Pterula gracilis]
MFPGASLARSVAQQGFDFILVDTEHGNIDDAAMHAAVQAIAAENVASIIRIAAPENWMVKRALDTGAHGILCPMMNNAEDARRLVSYAKFPSPKAVRDANVNNPNHIEGVRGVGSPFAPAAFRQGMVDYVAEWNHNCFVAVQIETAEGLANVDEIAAVPGIDMLFIGPNDLTSSLGFPFHLHPTLPESQEAFKQVLAAARKHNKFAGMFCTSADGVRKAWEQGYDFMNLGADVVAMGVWNATELGKLGEIRK